MMKKQQNNESGMTLVEEMIAWKKKYEGKRERDDCEYLKALKS